MIIAGLWRYGDWRHVATGCNDLVMMIDCFVLCSFVTSSLVAPGAGVLACHRPWLKSSLLKMEATFGQFSEQILRHSKTCDVWWCQPISHHRPDKTILSGRVGVSGV